LFLHVGYQIIYLLELPLGFSVVWMMFSHQSRRQRKVCVVLKRSETVLLHLPIVKSEEWEMMTRLGSSFFWMCIATVKRYVYDKITYKTESCLQMFMTIIALLLETGSLHG
jgi:hypothetical protein